MRRPIACFVCVIFMAASLAAAPARDKAQRIAVLEFENVTRDKTLDWVGTGIKEHLTTQLSQIPSLVVVERARLGDALKELKFNRSQFVDPATAQKMGKMLGAQSVVVGSYQKFEESMRIYARLVDVETGEVKAPTQVDGPYKKLLDLQNEVAKKLVAEMKGALGEADRKQLETSPTSNLDAYRLLSDGVYYLRNDLLDEALTQFDLALQADPNYSEAYYYKGVCLQRKQKWDEAAAALKKALPHSQQLRNVKWSWPVRYEQEKSERGRIPLMDVESVIERDMVAPWRNVAYGERLDQQTAIQFVQLDRRTSERVVFDDPNVLFIAPGLTGGSRAVFQSVRLAVQQVEDVTLAAFDASSGQTWRRTFSIKDGTFAFMVFRDLVLQIYPKSGRLAALDPDTGADRWSRDNVGLSALGLTLQRSKALGPLIVGRSENPPKLHVLRAGSGEEVWSTDLPSKDTLAIPREGVVVVFAPSGVRAFELDTGHSIALPALEAGSLRQDVGLLGNMSLPLGVIRRGVLYFWTKDRTLAAVDLSPAARTEARLLWQVPMESQPSAFQWDGEGLYVGTQPGEVLLFDARTGSQRGAITLPEKEVALAETGKGVVVATTASAVYALDSATGRKKWEYPDKFTNKEARYFKGAVIFRTSMRDVVCLDAETGSMLWQHSGGRMPGIHVLGETLFISDDDGVKEYSTERLPVAGIADKEVYTELARTALLRGEPKEAQVHAQKVLSDIDANYAPAHLVLGRAFQEQRDGTGAAREFAAFLNLEGPESRLAHEVIADLRKNHGLLWYSDAEAPLSAAYELAGKLINHQGVSGEAVKIYAFDRASGRAVWKHAGERFLKSAPDFEHKRVLYVTGRRENPQTLDLFAVNADTGERRKITTLTLPQQANAADIAYTDGVVVVNGVRLDFQGQKVGLQIRAVNAESGKTIWEKAFEQSLTNPPGLFFGRGQRFIFSTDKDLWIFKPTDGSVLVHEKEAGAIVGSPFAWQQEVPSDTLYYATTDQKMAAFDLAQRRILWHSKIGGLSSQTVISTSGIRNGVLYDWDQNFVFAVRLAETADKSADLPLLWKLDAGSGKTFRQMDLAGGRVFALRSDNTLLELDPATGKVLSERPLLWEAFTTHVAQDAVYVFSSTGRAYALSIGTR